MDSLKQNMQFNSIKKSIIRGLGVGIILWLTIFILNNISNNAVIIFGLFITYFLYEFLLDFFVFPKFLKIRDDEFLRYKNCKANKLCGNCHIDALLYNMFKFTPDLICFKDPKLRYVMCSKFFKESLGFASEKDFIGKTPMEIFPPEIAETISRYDSSVLKNRVSKSYVLKFNIKGEDILYELVSAPIVSEGEVVGVLTLSRDITETRHTTESLEFLNNQLYALINNAPMLAYVLDIDGNLILGNARAKDFLLTGLDVTIDGEKIQYDVDVLFKDIVDENSRVIQSGISLQTEKKLIGKNGEAYWYLSNSIPMKNKEGKVYAVTTFLRNIDAEKRMSEERETYIATLSHDLKTPAIAQVRALELLLSGQLGEFNEEQREMLKLTLDSCKYMYDMVYTLLSTYKFENGDISLNYSSFDISKMIFESINEISNLASENSIKIDFTTKDGEVKISADRMELKRVVINLLSNAINYAFPGSTVNVYLNLKNDKVEVKVQNAGPYIEPEVMEKLFRKYVTHSEKYNKVGIGLGLYLSKKIIETHQGKIIAESAKTNQNTFGFEVPIYLSEYANISNKVEAL